MSYAPQKLIDAGNYLAAHGFVFLGIVGDSLHGYGYHLGRDRLPSGDYSAYYPRDRAGLTDAASALDIGGGDIRVLCSWMVAEAWAGRRQDTREIIGPRSDGRACRWAAETGWREELRSKGDSHEWHIHESYYRDSEYRDKTQYFRPYFEEDDVTPAELFAAQLPAGGGTFGGAISTLLARTNYLANVLDIASKFNAVMSKLDAVLVAANDDTQVNVTLDDASKAALVEGKAMLTELRTMVAAVPDATVDVLRQRIDE